MTPRDTLRLALGVTRLAVTRPVEVVDRIDGWREYKKSEANQRGPGDHPDRDHRDALTSVHRLLGVEECSTCIEEISETARLVSARLPSGHSHDGGDALTTTVWAIVRHTRPRHVVETGVAQGVSSAFILTALRKNGHGHLWSIDLPPVSRPKGLTGRAVAPELHDRWTYLHGATRRVLPGLLEELDSVDLFVHDSLHTESTMTFEFNNVWTYLAEGATLVADDANFNSAFLKFSRRVGREPLLLAERKKGNTIGIIHI